jgi:putative transposase
MAQVARNLTDAVDGFLRGKNKFVADRDAKFTEAFRKTLAGAGVETVQTALRPPNKNEDAERFVKSINDEFLSRMVFFRRPGHVPQCNRAIAEFVAHYHTERNHQGLGNRLLRPGPSLPESEGAVYRQVRLDGLPSLHHRRKRRAAS